MMQFFFILALVVAAALSRLIPHAANFAPHIALCFFCAAYIRNRMMAVSIPLLSMLLSDLFLDGHPYVFSVYGSMALISFGAFAIKRPGSCFLAVLPGTLLFYLVTNFDYWLRSGLYPWTGKGLFTCYVAALPFLKHSLTSSLFYSVVLFGTASTLNLLARRSFGVSPESFRRSG